MSANQYKLEKYLRKYKETNKMKYLDKVMYYLKVGGGPGDPTDNMCIDVYNTDNVCNKKNCVEYEFGEDNICRGNDIPENIAKIKWLIEKKNDKSCKTDTDCGSINCNKYEFGEDNICRGKHINEKQATREWLSEKKTKLLRPNI
jgi:hypothetical protein